MHELQEVSRVSSNDQAQMPNQCLKIKWTKQ